jgi:23S rRNA pseudouridine1911/1915/1917 synthase
MLTSVVSEHDAGVRCDRYLAQAFPQFSRAQIQRWLGVGAITINGDLAKAAHKVHAGDQLTVRPPEPAPSR